MFSVLRFRHFYFSSAPYRPIAYNKSGCNLKWLHLSMLVKYTTKAHKFCIHVHHRSH
uniref:Uncharacterized protein n=1 Tax=Anguilla anguilla TaxID=7936 RepID=A0A0E9XT66_ANGAN